MSRVRSGPERSERLRAPLLLGLWVLMVLEAASGWVLFVAYLVAGRRPGEALHIALGVPLAIAYAIYQWGHWRRVAPLRGRPDHVLGLVAAIVLSMTLASGLALGVCWWAARFGSRRPGEVAYPVTLSALHNIGSMLVAAFVGAHLGAVLLREAGRDRGDGPTVSGR